MSGAKVNLTTTGTVLRPDHAKSRSQDRLLQKNRRPGYYRCFIMACAELTSNAPGASISSALITPSSITAA